jgi:hypothetical protein
MVGRTVPASVLAAINSETFALPAIVLIILANGTRIALTEWDEPLDVDLDGNGVETFSPVQFQQLSAFSAQINAPIDDRELTIILGDTTLTASDVRRGRLNNAVAIIGYVLPAIWRTRGSTAPMISVNPTSRGWSHGWR